MPLLAEINEAIKSAGCPKENPMRTRNLFAPVVPFRYIQGLKNFMTPQWAMEILGPYHLWLAHDVLEMAKDTSTMGPWWQVSSDLKNHFGSNRVNIIMDNSVIELKEAATITNTVKAASYAGAHVAVIPDVLRDAALTMEAFDTAMEEMTTQEFAAMQWGGELMFVPQGKTFKDFVTCMEYVEPYDVVKWIGIPRLATDFLGTRLELIKAAKSIFGNDVKIHMLGFSNNVYDDIVCAAQPGIMGIDSAVPVRAGLKGIPWRISRSDYGKRDDYWEACALDATSLNLSADNIMTVRSSIRNLNAALTW